MKTAAHHPLSGSLAKSTVAAILTLESLADDRAVYPRVPASACRVLRILGEDAVRQCPIGISAEAIESALGFPQGRVATHLHDLPGLLAIHAPGTVRIVREKSGGKGCPHIYRLVPAR